MIEDPPMIRRKQKIARPSTSQIEAFSGIPTGFVADALGGRGAMAPAIKPVVPEHAIFCGVALPVHCGPADNLAVMMSLPHVQKGDVIIAATDGYCETAVTGDLLIGMLRNLGAVGFVTDGAVRDIVGIRDMGLPCFAAAVTPNSPVRNGPGTINLPIVCGGVAVCAGDIVVADIDGIVIVPFNRIDETIIRLEHVKAAEALLLPKVQSGLGIPDWVSELETKIRTVLVDE
jgi:4-hydroxy-4-methyl-2-oxoglutarate aldolase